MNTTGTGRNEKANYVIVAMEVSDGAKVPSTYVRAKLSELKAISEMGPVRVVVPAPDVSITHYLSLTISNYLILFLSVKASWLQELYSWGSNLLTKGQ